MMPSNFLIISRCDSKSITLLLVVPPNIKSLRFEKLSYINGVELGVATASLIWGIGGWTNKSDT